MIIFLHLKTLTPHEKAPPMMQLDLLRADSEWSEPVSSVVLHLESNKGRLTHNSVKIIETLFNSSDLLCWTSLAQYNSFRLATRKMLKKDISRNSVILPDKFKSKGYDPHNLYEIWSILRCMGITSQSKLRTMCEKTVDCL